MHRKHYRASMKEMGEEHMNSLIKKTIRTLLILIMVFSLVFSNCVIVNAETAKQIVFEEDIIRSINAYSETNPFTKDGITITASLSASFRPYTITLGGEGTSVTFSSSVGKISRIDIYCLGTECIADPWVCNGDILTWRGIPSESVSISGSEEFATVEYITKIVFTISDNTSVDSVSIYIDGKTADTITLYLKDSVANKVSLSSVVLPAVADQTVVWTSSDTSIATVSSSGLVMAVGEGEATITVTATCGTEETDDDKTATCKVIVEDNIMPDSGPTGKVIQVVNSFNPSGGILGKGQSHVYYGMTKTGVDNGFDCYWRVLDNEKSSAGDDNCMFLMTENLISQPDSLYYEGGIPFNLNNKIIDWDSSELKKWCKYFFNNFISSGEKDAVIKTNKFEKGPEHSPDFDFDIGPYESNTLTNEEIFVLSKIELSDAAYGFSDNASRIATYKGTARAYWTRTPALYKPEGEWTYWVFIVIEKGNYNASSVSLGDYIYARPAMNLDLSKVLLTSAAVNGKESPTLGTFNAVSDYSGSDWKLTLLDSSREFAVSSVSQNGTSVTVKYSNAVEGDNEYISAIIVNASGKVTYYGRIAKASSAPDTTLTFDLGSAYAEGDTLYIFNEQYNGDKNTDYASELLKIKVSAMVTANDKGSSLSLKDKISINIYVGIPDDAEGWTAKLFYEKNGFDTPIRTYALDKTSANGYSSKNDEYKFVYSEISAKEMTEKVRVIIYDEQGAQVKIKAKDGKLKESIDFCAADWANTMINDPTRPAKTVNLAKALLNFGGEAQNYWEYKPEVNANAAGYLASEMAAVTANNLKAFAPVKDASASAVGENGISLSLKSETYLNVYFTKEVTVSAANLNGAKIAVNKSGKEWVAKITGITAKNLGNQYTLTIKSGSTTSTQKYSALTWAYNVLEKGTSAKAIPLAKALYLYQQAAVEYFK